MPCMPLTRPAFSPSSHPDSSVREVTFVLHSCRAAVDGGRGHFHRPGVEGAPLKGWRRPFSVAGAVAVRQSHECAALEMSVQTYHLSAQKNTDSNQDNRVALIQLASSSMVLLIKVLMNRSSVPAGRGEKHQLDTRPLVNFSLVLITDHWAGLPAR